MTEIAPTHKILFVINPGSGKNNIDWQTVISNYFSDLLHDIAFFTLSAGCRIDSIKNKIKEFNPQRVVAVGGDGTIKLVSECLLHSDRILGIIPAGSANGMAKELGIPIDTKAALEVILSGAIQTIHVVKVNDQYSIHLSDIGFNAFIVKKFESENIRGMWGYLRAAWKVLWTHNKMNVQIEMGKKMIVREAAMIVVANATRYGSGAVINPEGRLDDDLFEVIILKKISAREIFKMMVTHKPYDTTKTELLQSSELRIRSRKKLHFQVDGQYIGKVNSVDAVIVPRALRVISPTPAATDKV